MKRFLLSTVSYRALMIATVGATGIVVAACEKTSDKTPAAPSEQSDKMMPAQPPATTPAPSEQKQVP